MPCVSVPAPSKVVSTHSRLKAAGAQVFEQLKFYGVSTHSRLKAAGQCRGGEGFANLVSTHSRLKAAGGVASVFQGEAVVSTHSRLKAAGKCFVRLLYVNEVSTHSRLKAAGLPVRRPAGRFRCFNTQPPEGGWVPTRVGLISNSGFNTQPPEGGWHRGCAARL